MQSMCWCRILHEGTSLQVVLSEVPCVSAGAIENHSAAQRVLEQFDNIASAVLMVPDLLTNAVGKGGGGSLSLSPVSIQHHRVSFL